MRLFTKESLIAELRDICNRGWIDNARHGNVGGIGNTLEDLLGIPENNLPIPNAAEWELKTQRLNTSSLTTLFHMEPSPTALSLVPAILLPKYGWAHQEAGGKHPSTEMSFRQTINGLARTDRGFGVEIDLSERKVMVSFDSTAVGAKHAEWLESVRSRVGHLHELDVQPYWGFDDLYAKARTKLLNCFYVRAEVRRNADGSESYRYCDVLMCQELSLDRFLAGLQKGYVLIDFDARSGHNHGTKFRLRQDKMPDMYAVVTKVV